MKRKINALLLALGLGVSLLSMGVYAEETGTEQVAAAEDGVAEAESELEEAAQAEAETETTETVSADEQIRTYLTSTLAQISSWSDENIEMIINGDDASSAVIASNWKSVKDELGAFVEVTSAELSEDGTAITGHVKYAGVSDNTDVIVTYSVDQTEGTFKVEWEVDYPLSVNMARAGMNTVMGLVIVFVALFFLSWVIGKLHLIPEMIEKRQKKDQPVQAVPAAPAPAAPAAVEENLTDDLELVAVITAAIAASGTTSGDGFVVRSIKKSNKRNWQRA